VKLSLVFVFTLHNTNYRKLPVRLFDDFLWQALRIFVLMVESDNNASNRICQLPFIMVGLLSLKKQMSQHFNNNLSELNVLRRKHNSFWQRGAGLASLANQKGLSIYSSTNKENDCLSLAA